MSEGYYKVQPVSRKQLRELAKTLRRKLGLENAVYIDIIYLIEHVFPVICQKWGFSVEILPKEDMKQNHGLTNPQSGKIFIREDVYDGACMGNGRDRLTIAHEIGHYLLHDGVTLGLARASQEEHVAPYRDPEWQATAFAAEFLMDHDIIRDMGVSEIASKCGVSLVAARYQKNK